MHLGNPAIAPNLFGRCSSLTASHPTAVKWPVLVHVLISGSVSMVLGVRCVPRDLTPRSSQGSFHVCS